MKKLISNFLYSIGMHVIKIIMPLLLFPIIARYLGAEGLGAFTFYQAITIIISSAIEYGYAYSAVNKIATSNNKTQEVIIKEVESSRIFLSIAIFIISFIISVYEKDYLIILSVITGIFTGLLPIYIFHARDRFKELAIIELIAIIIYYTLSFILLYIFIEIWCVVVSLMISRVYVLYSLRKKIKLKYCKFNLSTAKTALKSLKLHFIYFCHRASIVIYSTITTVLIKYIYDNNILGFYSSAEKIVVALCGISGPIQSVLLPYLSKNKKGNIINLFYFFLISSILIFSFSTAYYSDSIFKEYYGDGFNQGSDYYKFLIWLFPLKIISSFISTDLFLSKGLQKYFSSIYLVIISVILPIILFITYFYGIFAMISTLLISEGIFILSLLIVYKVINIQRHCNNGK